MNIQKLNIIRVPFVNLLQVCGMKYFPPPPNYDHIVIPEKPKLRFVEKVPFFSPGMRQPRMQKRLHLMRGPETTHNFFIHKQYGIIALGGGRMKWRHFEMVRMTLGRKIDVSRMFAIWRVDPPWQPITKKGQGQRMGGGKGAIDEYVTPVKEGRVIIEVAGKCEFDEVQYFLNDIAMKLPFKAAAVCHEDLTKMKEKEKWEEENNQNYHTMKYIMQNNIGGCYRWMTPFDFKFLGRYL